MAASVVRRVGTSQERRLSLWVAALVLAVVACAGQPEGTPTASVTAAVEADVDDFLGYADPYGQVRAVLAYRDAKPVLESHISSTPEDFWGVQSVTKSVVSVLVGAAIQHGYLTGASQTLGKLLPEHADVMSPEVQDITLGQVLSHTAGFEDCCSSGGEPHFASSTDWVTTILQERSAVTDPSAGFAYSEAGAHLAGAIVAQAAGMPLLEFAREALFEPLGIPSDPAFDDVAVVGPDDTAVDEFLDGYYAADFAWPADPQGINDGSTSLKLRPQDLARIGQLYLDQGSWDGEQLVPESWIDESTRGQTDATGATDSYGYLWWVTDVDGAPAYFAWGFGGQLLEVVPDLGLVVVIATEVDLRDPLVDTKANTLSPAVVQEVVRSVIAPHFAAE